MSSFMVIFLNWTSTFEWTDVCRRESFSAPKSASIDLRAAPGAKLRRSRRVMRKTARSEAREDVGDSASADTQTTNDFSPGEPLIWSNVMGHKYEHM